MRACMVRSVYAGRVLSGTHAGTTMVSTGTLAAYVFDMHVFTFVVLLSSSRSNRFQEAFREHCFQAVCAEASLLELGLEFCYLHLFHFWCG